MGPVRVGNQAYEQVQHDAYGQIVLSNAQAFFDQRLFRMAGVEDFEALEPVGERAWAVLRQARCGPVGIAHQEPCPHLFGRDVLGGVRPAGQCRRACWAWTSARRSGGTAPIAIRATIEAQAWRDDTQRMSATFGGDDLDASLIQLLDLRFLAPDDPRFRGTLAAVEEGLRRGSHMLRYATEDDFGLPETAFNVCTFWLIEALHATGRDRRCARAVRGDARRAAPPPACCPRISIPQTGELWGNYPQTYSLVGLINCAVLLSKPWSADPMSRLIVISNRGLAPTGARRRRPGRARGRADRGAARKRRHLVRLVGRGDRRASPARSTCQRHDGVTTATIDLEDAGHRGILQRLRQPHAWPLFHYRIDLAEYRARLRRRL